MEKKMKIGTPVLIFSYVGEMGDHQDIYHYKKGVIESCMEIEELTMTRDVPKKRFFYTVLGDDGKHYRGNYGSGNFGSSYFRTKEDHKKFLAEEIANLEEKRALINRQIDSLKRTRSILTQENITIEAPTSELMK